MAEGKKTINEAQNELLDEFVNSLRNKKTEKPLKSREQYRQVVNALAVDGAFTTNKTKNFLELFIKSLAENVNVKDNVKNNLLSGLKNDIEGFKKSWNENGKKSYITYLNRFIEFCKKQQNKKYKKNAYDFEWDTAAIAAWSGYDNAELYLPNVLRTKFKSRLRCQDRTSGDKIWLPLRFIGKIFSEAKKSDMIEENLFSKWLDNLVNSIYIHYNNSKEEIETTKFGENGVSLLLKKDGDGFKVYVIKSDSPNGYPVLTPTGKGNQKIPMKVKNISDIAIDHVISIDRILRDLSEQEDGLPQLMIVSNKYKKLQIEDEPNEKGAIKELLRIINLETLAKELAKISAAGLLRLMSSKYNSQKSNGDTFKKIVKCDNSYYGILETDIKNDMDNESQYVLYQNLKDNGVNRTTSNKRMPLDELEVLDKAGIEKIINCI